jgi:plasmid stabilization system protein ParE
MQIDWSELAREDIRDLHSYIAKDSPHYARQFAERIIAAVKRLNEFPESGRRVPEARSDVIRELLVAEYRIIYQLELPERVVVLAVFHGRRDLTAEEAQPWRPK